MATYHDRSIAPLAINKIDTTAGTQYRVATDKEVIEDMEDLIERGVTFKTPMKIALFEGHYYLVDGFHRYAAYMNKQVPEVPAGQWECIEVSTFEEIRLLAMGANVAHGKSNTKADYYYIIKKLMELKSDKYMKNVFEPDIDKIADALGAPKPSVKRGYSNYFGTDKNSHPSIYQVCIEKRNAAIMQEHEAGTSDGEIAKLFKMSQQTVSRIRAQLTHPAQKAKCVTPNETLTIETLQTSTPDETKIEDAGSYLSSITEEVMNKEPVEEEVEEEVYSWEDHEEDDGLIDPNAPAPIDLTGLDYQPNKPRSQVKPDVENPEQKTTPYFLAQVQGEHKEKLEKLKMAMVTAGFSETEAAIYAGQVVQRQTLSIAGKQSREFLKINKG
ncbi:hypothetical protein [Aeromonas veronii]|uniref:hypothetical protein n=1 Tax=Aeromonas veronii TaxID=654 RepID=UPI003D2485A6